MLVSSQPASAHAGLLHAQMPCTFRKNRCALTGMTADPFGSSA